MNTAPQDTWWLDGLKTAGALLLFVLALSGAVLWGNYYARHRREQADQAYHAWSKVHRDITLTREEWLTLYNNGLLPTN